MAVRGTHTHTDSHTQHTHTHTHTQVELWLFVAHTRTNTHTHTPTHTQVELWRQHVQDLSEFVAAERLRVTRLRKATGAAMSNAMR